MLDWRRDNLGGIVHSEGIENRRRAGLKRCSGGENVEKGSTIVSSVRKFPLTGGEKSGKGGVAGLSVCFS